MNENMDNKELLITLTADIVAAHVGHNSVAVGDVANLIANVHGALHSLVKAPEPVEDKPKGAVSIRSSLKHDYIVSMIDGKPYKMLRRHLSQNGYTPESYRETFGLPKDYPMTAPAYTEQRRALAKKIGLGRKAKATAPEPTVKVPARRGRKPRAKPAPA
ncbi:MucR family transcriptional regulator [Sphingobium ummariense]|uniref:MucR family transcriptional regulator n=1 Tax=Sphingobium ummariense RL-3 TaxID=1346791 RepID=T0KAB5_9SPHN|nr:MucR family transcriptional regulator [Sphingobium ummariense]EQB30368.1 hypothetical protein M529_20105 [Sphingobium ummariense RL-3]